MRKTLNTCTKFLSKITCIALSLTLFSCGKAIDTSEGEDQQNNQRRFLETTEIKLSQEETSYKMPGSAQLYLPEYIDFVEGNNESSLKLVFSKGVFMQEFICYYDYSAGVEDYLLDECYLTDHPSESLGYEAGEEIYQAKGNVLELISFENTVQAKIEIDWFSK